MSNMRVKMILDLVANTGKGADKAKKDLKGVKDAANGIKGGAGSGADKLRRDLDRLTPAARKAAKELAIAGHRERQIGRDSGVKRTRRELDQTASAARKAARELAIVGHRERQIGRDGGVVKTRRQLHRALNGGGRLNAERRAAPGLAASTGPIRHRRSSKASAPATAAAEGGGASLLAAGRGLMPMVGAYMGYQGVKAVGRNTVGKSISFESAMADVKRKVDLPDGGSFEQIEDWINKAAVRFGKSRTEVAGLVAELGAAGIAYEDLSKAIELNTKAAVAWDMGAAETGDTMAKIRTGQNWQMQQLEDFGDKVNALADAGASKERDIVEMFQRAGAAGLIAGLDADTSLAFLTGMNSAGIQPEIAARGYSAMMSKLRVADTAGTDSMEEGFKLLGLTGKQVEDGMKKDAVKTLHAFIERFQKAKDQAGAATLIFGQGWWDEFSRMVQAMPEIKKNLSIVSDPSKWRGSMGKSLNIELETSANHLARLEALTSRIGDNLGRWMLPGINEGVNKIVQAMDAFDEMMRRREQAKEAGKRTAEGEVLTEEQVRRRIEDQEFRDTVNRRAYEHNYGKKDAQGRVIEETIRNNRGAANEADRRRNQLRLQKDQEIEGLEYALRSADPSGRSPMYRGKREQLARLRGERKTLGPMWQETIVPPDARTVAFQEEQARLGGYIATADDYIKRDPQNAGTTKKVRGDYRRALAKSRRDMRLFLAPDRTAIQTYGDPNTWGTPVGEGNPGSIGSTGRSSFGLNRGGYSTGGSWDGKAGKRPRAGSRWANRINTDFDHDIDHGLTIRLGDKIAENIAAAGGQVQGAAQGLVDSVNTTLAGADMSGAGQQAAASYAKGLMAGVPWVAAAAGKLKATAAASMSGGGSGGGRVAGALHDGVE